MAEPVDLPDTSAFDEEQGFEKTVSTEGVSGDYLDVPVMVGGGGSYTIDRISIPADGDTHILSYDGRAYYVDGDLVGLERNLYRAAKAQSQLAEVHMEMERLRNREDVSEEAWQRAFHEVEGELADRYGCDGIIVEGDCLVCETSRMLKERLGIGEEGA